MMTKEKSLSIADIGCNGPASGKAASFEPGQHKPMPCNLSMKAMFLVAQNLQHEWGERFNKNECQRENAERACEFIASHSAMRTGVFVLHDEWLGYDNPRNVELEFSLDATEQLANEILKHENPSNVLATTIAGHVGKNLAPNLDPDDHGHTAMIYPWSLSISRIEEAVSKLLRIELFVRVAVIPGNSNSSSDQTH